MSTRSTETLAIAYAVTCHTVLPLDISRLIASYTPDPPFQYSVRVIIQPKTNGDLHHGRGGLDQYREVDTPEFRWQIVPEYTIKTFTRNDAVEKMHSLMKQINHNEREYPIYFKQRSMVVFRLDDFESATCLNYFSISRDPQTRLFTSPSSTLFLFPMIPLGTLTRPAHFERLEKQYPVLISDQKRLSSPNKQHKRKLRMIRIAHTGREAAGLL